MKSSANINASRNLSLWMIKCTYLFIIILMDAFPQVSSLSFQSSSKKPSGISEIQSFFNGFMNQRSSILSNKPSKPTEEMLERVHFLILPGFGNASEDYTMPRSLVPTLVSRGWNDGNISVLPVERINWLQVFLCGCFDLQFWLADAAPTRPAFRWYLQKVASEVKRIKSEKGEESKVVLLGHSAGGWLARASVGYGNTEVYPKKDVFDSNVQVNKDDVIGIVTLGAPHLPPPSGEMDMTRGALRITNELFPASFHLPSGIIYLTVAGTAVRGKEQLRESLLEPTTATGFAYNSYKAVCGEGNTIGDGVVPLEASHLENSIQITLDNCFHSINAPEQWYGSDLYVDEWHGVLLQELHNTLSRK